MITNIYLYAIMRFLEIVLLLNGTIQEMQFLRVRVELNNVSIIQNELDLDDDDINIYHYFEIMALYMTINIHNVYCLFTMGINIPLMLQRGSSSL